MSKIIGVAGQIANGKDTTADYIYDQLISSGETKWQRRSFAVNVKKVFCDIFLKTPEYVEEWKRKSEIPEDLDCTVRSGLQMIGDGFRKIKSTIWIDLAFRDDDDKIISDVRYINELERIKSLGGLTILVVRPDMINDDPNGSEAQLRPLAEWAVNHPDKVFPNDEVLPTVNDRPFGLEYVDIILINDTDVNALKSKIDEVVLPRLTNHYDTSCNMKMKAFD
jgi:hypothetical protein